MDAPERHIAESIAATRNRHRRIGLMNSLQQGMGYPPKSSGVRREYTPELVVECSASCAGLGPIQGFGEGFAENPFLIFGGEEAERLAEQIETFAVGAGEAAEISTPQHSSRTETIIDAAQEGMKVAEGICFVRKARRGGDHHEDFGEARQG